MAGKKRGKAKQKRVREEAKQEAAPSLGSFKTTAEVPVPERIVDQIIGQEKAVSIIRKAAKQKRNVLLIGTPGTGKSMLAQAMAELLDVQELEDVLVYANPDDENSPIVKVVKAGQGRKTVQEQRFKNRMSGGNINLISMLLVVILSFFLLAYGRQQLGDVITAALLIGLFAVTAALAFASQIGRARLMPGMDTEPAKLIVDNHDKKKAPFVDASGARAGALLGDCRHDPLQSTIDDTTLFVKVGGKLTKTTFGKLWSKVARKYSELVEKHPDSYEAIVFPKKEKVYTVGYRKGKAVMSRIYSLNRYMEERETVELETPTTTVTLTSEHKVITPRGSKAAEKVKSKQELITLE